MSSGQYYHCRVCSSDAAAPDAQSNYVDCEVCTGRAELRSPEAPLYSPVISEADTDYWEDESEEEDTGD
tara:strand:+ start:108 stop:314 length:207 start_codon:yes stop_codon:yes gene_type:complete